MPENPRTRATLANAHWITLAIGLLFVAVGAESLAAVDVCVADPACLPGAGGLNVEAFFAILAVGFMLVVAAVRGLTLRWRAVSTAP